MPDSLLDTIPQSERDRLAVHNLAQLERSREKIAALLNCKPSEAEQQAIAVRKRLSHAL